MSNMRITKAEIQVNSEGQNTTDVIQYLAYYKPHISLVKNYVTEKHNTHIKRLFLLTFKLSMHCLNILICLSCLNQYFSTIKSWFYSQAKGTYGL